MVNHEILLFIAVVLLSKLLYLYSYWWKKGVQIVGYPVPFFGHALQHLVFGHSYVELLNNYYVKFKSKRFVGGYVSFKPYLLMADPELCKKIYADYFDKFSERGYSNVESFDPLAVNLITLDSVRWKLIREDLQPAMNSNKCKLLLPVCLKASDNLIENIKRNFHNNEPSKIDILIRNYLIEFFITTSLGITYESFLQNPKLKEIINEILHPNKLNTIRTFLTFAYPDILRILKWNRLTDNKIDYLQNFFLGIYEARKKNHSGHKDLFMTLAHILTSEKIKSKFQDWKKLLMSNCVLMIVAGTDTSHTALTLLLWQIARKPDVQEKLYQDVKRSLDLHGGNITEAITDMPYMDATIQEALRMYPPFPFTLRLCKERCKLEENGPVLDVGDHVIIPIEAIHYDPEYFPDPYTFNPERFLKMSMNDYKNTYMPFGKGPRNCVGYQFARYELRVSVATIVKNFKFHVGPETPEEIKFQKYAFAKKIINTVSLYPELRT